MTGPYPLATIPELAEIFKIPEQSLRVWKSQHRFFPKSKGKRPLGQKKTIDLFSIKEFVNFVKNYKVERINLEIKSWANS